jgi:Flp pilus assembly protein TadD
VNFEQGIAVAPANGQEAGELDNELAWLLSTASQQKIRDGGRAVELATKACELTGYKDAGCLDTLAAAYAESGDFETAVKWAEESVKAVKAENLGKDEKQIAEHLKAFRSGEPWREL